MNWNALTSPEQLETIREESNHQPVLLFKHSTACSTSRMVLARIERSWNEAELPEVKPYYLDLLAFRNISNQIAADFQVQHESPQVLIIRHGQSVYDRSHLEIDYQAIKAVLKN
jgi:bacillithiol system protein YtxJ